MKEDSSERRFRTGSGIVVDAVYDASASDGESPGEPGKFPFTRGIYPNMYRGRLWTILQDAGLGTAWDGWRGRRRIAANGGKARGQR